MALVNTKCQNVTDLDAGKKVPNYRFNSKEQAGTVAIAAGDDAASVYRVGRVHSSWRISEILRFNDTLTSASDVDVGLYDTAENGGEAVDKDLFADGINIATASIAGVRDQFQTLDKVNIEKRVWELISGLTVDPNKFYDLCYTFVSKGAAAGDLSVIIKTQPGT